jgi:hypothetical protein
MRCPLLLIAGLAAALGLLASGCGGGGGRTPGVANVGATTTTAQSGLVAFSACMRSHGVSNFPDPQHFADGHLKQTLAGYPPNDTQLQRAINQCQQFLPTNGGTVSTETPQLIHARLVDALSFARCMRSHGVRNFPDPTAQGQLTIEMVQAQGIDVHSSTFLRDVQECLPASHGALTPAMVRQALAGAGH